MEFVLPDFSVTGILTEVSGQFFEGATPPTLEDMSYQIILNADVGMLNQIFLFYTDDTNNLEASLNDLTDLNQTDLKYALHVSQWNPTLQTNKADRKHVIANLLADIFGGSATSALFNIDVFSNEEELDNDISNIFTSRVSSMQRDNLTNASANMHGVFVNNVPLDQVVASGGDTPEDVKSNSLDSVSRSLLEQAAIHILSNPTSDVLRRQFDTTNTSNADFNLQQYWRTFQFVENDLIKFNVIVRQPPSFYPSWSANSDATTVGGNDTRYQITLIAKNSPTTPLAHFSQL